MKTDTHWYVRLGLVILALTMTMVAMSCGGGGGGTVARDRTDPGSGIAYGDSLPIHLGHGGSGSGIVAGPEVLIIRNDGGLAEANLQALHDDLTTLGAQWSQVDYDNPPGSWTNLQDYLAAQTQLMVVIWYHGGTGDAGEVSSGPFMDPWDESEMDDYLQTLNDGYHMLHIDPYHGHIDWSNAWYNYARPDGILTFVGQHLPANPIANPPNGWGQKLDKAASSHGDYWAAIPGYMGDAIGFTPNSAVPWGNLGLTGPDDAAGAMRAEIYDGSGSSGWRPLTISYDDRYQISVMGITTTMYSPLYTNGFFVPGINLDVQYGPWWNLHSSWGNTMAPDEGFPYSYTGGPSWTTGPSRLWVMGYAYAPINITTSNKPSGKMERYELLRNVLAWLDDGLTFGNGELHP